MSRVPTDDDLRNYNAHDGGLPAADITSDAERTEMANARRFIELHGENVRFCPPWGRWLVWDGKRLKVDDENRIAELAGDVVEQIWRGVEQRQRQADRSDANKMVSFAVATASARGIANFLKLAAETDSTIKVMPADLDKHEWLLNVENGTIDLRTGEIKAHDKRDNITKLAPVLYTRHRTSETWERFIGEIMANDAELIGFIQRLCGYWLTGSTRDHVLPICYGLGANGKSVFLNTIQAMLGPDYAMHAGHDLLMVKRHDPHPTERADLFGKRLVTCIETEAGRRLDEPLVKELTGGDSIRARRMREDHWEFRPTHKLVIAANHRPVVRGTDIGIWRRLRLLPFMVTIPPERQDKALTDKLRKELHGVLTWCVQGCIAWQKQGLAEPSSVAEATATYRNESDVLGEFIDACCTIDEKLNVSGGRLYQAYVEWCKANGHDPDNATVFGRKLSERGYVARKVHGTKVREGIGLINAPNEF